MISFRLIGLYILFAFITFHWIACSSPKAFVKKDAMAAQKLLGLDFAAVHMDTILPYLERNRRGYDTLRKYTVDIETFPALLFDPHPVGFDYETIDTVSLYPKSTSTSLPDNLEELAFYSIPQLADLLRRQVITSEALTRMYIDRLKRHDVTLKCAATITEDLALQQAQRADKEIAAGNYRGPLHGIPYGVKDLMAVDGYPTTWGARPYQNQMLEGTAEVVQQLEDAGAVLIAKLTSGALARGDVWWGGKTVNPWDTLQGASGSSAGSGSATAAGLVGFSLGTETLGSIVSPSNRNGVTGLRPTYGRVSRSGVMALSWSMDKVGPICRSAQDCGIVLDIIQAREESKDPTVADEKYTFRYNSERSIQELKVGYIKDLVEKDTTESGDHLRSMIELIKEQGVELQEVSLPKEFPFAAFDVILRSEAGAFFDQLVRSKRVDMMVEQHYRSRANSLRQARFIPAVEYIQANRHRRELINEMHTVMKDLDVVITPTFGGPQLMITNLTGHPALCLPTGIDSTGHPTSLTILGNLYEENKILNFGSWLQELTDYHMKKPPHFDPTVKP